MDAAPAERQLFQFSLKTVLGFALACGVWLVIASSLDPVLRKKAVIYVLLPGTMLPALALCYSRPMWSILLVLYLGWIIGSYGAIQSSEEAKALRARQALLRELAKYMPQHVSAYNSTLPNPVQIDPAHSSSFQPVSAKGNPIVWKKHGDRLYLIDTGPDHLPGHPAPTERVKIDANSDGFDDGLDDAVFSWDPVKGVE